MYASFACSNFSCWMISPLVWIMYGWHTLKILIISSIVLWCNVVRKSYTQNIWTETENTSVSNAFSHCVFRFDSFPSSLFCSSYRISLLFHLWFNVKCSCLLWFRFSKFHVLHLLCFIGTIDILLIKTIQKTNELSVNTEASNIQLIH